MSSNKAWVGLTVNNNVSKAFMLTRDVKQSNELSFALFHLAAHKAIVMVNPKGNIFIKSVHAWAYYRDTIIIARYMAFLKNILQQNKYKA